MDAEKLFQMLAEDLSFLLYGVDGEERLVYFECSNCKRWDRHMSKGYDVAPRCNGKLYRKSPDECRKNFLPIETGKGKWLDKIFEQLAMSNCKNYHSTWQGGE